jgi:inosose dehydratase
MTTTARFVQVRVGINPIAWTNDDFHELGDDIPVERCLREARDAGYAGIELGRKLPRDANALASLLAAHDLVLASGWHSAHFLERPLASEIDAFRRHVDLLARCGSDVAIVAECSRRTYTERHAPLHFGAAAVRLSDPEWRRLADGLEAIADAAGRSGLRIAYHPHAGTVVPDAADVDRLLSESPATHLLFDSGHLELAGSDALDVLRRHARRVAHVHLKNVRPDVAARARSEAWPFERAVKAGVFTVPGDGGLDFAPMYDALGQARYAGWFVVEAEQDPSVAIPREFAARGREAVRRVAGV